MLCYNINKPVFDVQGIIKVIIIQKYRYI